MKKILGISMIVFMLIVLGASASAQGFECWQVTASVLNVRSGPGTEHTILQTVSYGSTLNGTNNGTGWVQQDTGGWLSQQYLVRCEGANVSTTSTAPTTPSTVGVEYFGSFGSNLVTINKPGWMDSNDLIQLVDVVTHTYQDRWSVCPERPIVINFGGSATGTMMAGGRHFDYLEGYYNLLRWDGGANFVEDLTSDDCNVYVHGIFILEGMGTAVTWGRIAHEISHMFYILHGATSPSWVNDADNTLQGLNDSWWVDYETQKAAAGNCGASPTEFCLSVYNSVFAQ